jgi:uncharacterized protein (DUF2336 family)
MSMAYLQMLARTPGRRDALLRELTDIFLESQRNPLERELFDDVADQVLNFVDAPARQQFAERLATRADAPRRVVVRLAGDAIAIAAPLLARSPVLTDDDIVALAQEKSQDHLAAIARRASLPAPVTDVLIARGRVDVLEALAANPAARFSVSGAEALIEKAQDRATLWRRLARRRDVAIAGTPWPHQGTGAPPRPLDAILDEVSREMIRFADAVVELADGDRITDVAALVCTRLAVDVPVLVHEMFAPNEVRLFRRCCEAQLDLDALSAVMRLRKRHHPLGAETISGMLHA